MIGYYAYKRTSNLSDYMLGGRALGPAVTALSAGASDMSGWLMMGLPGAMFATGLSGAWIVIGLVLGAWANWIYVAPRLRSYTEIAKQFNYDTVIFRKLGLAITRKFSGFFRVLSSSRFLPFMYHPEWCPGVLFNSILHLDYHTGLWIISAVVVCYTLFGGFLAVSWTDFVQGIIMFAALILVPLVTIIETDGPSEAFTEIRSIDPDLLNVFNGTSVLGIISLFAWGLGYFGQPHIIVRFMAISSVKEIKKARRIGMGWMIFSSIGALLTGLIGLAYYSQKDFIWMTRKRYLFNWAIFYFTRLSLNFLISAILAAIMSTISSQLLVTSSSLTEDLYKTIFKRSASDKELVFFGRLAVLVVSIIALWLGWSKNNSILGLVSYAWAGFGSSFGPVIILSLYWKRMTKWGLLPGLLWGQSLSLYGLQQGFPIFFMK
ncbi:sodium/proline symporter PutP [Bacillus sonorensis]|nr:sodium/proline symporter PutP [Bacillus sonorensis]